MEALKASWPCREEKQQEHKNSTAGKLSLKENTLCDSSISSTYIKVANGITSRRVCYFI